MITSMHENTEKTDQQNDELQATNLKAPIIDSQIQDSIDILNDIIIIQNDSLDQGIFYLPDFLDEKINTIKYEPMKIICQNFIDFRKKLNKSIENQFNSQQKSKKRGKKDDNHLFHFNSHNTRNTFYNTSIIDINPIQDDELTGSSSPRIENSNELQNSNDNSNNNDNNNDNNDNISMNSNTENISNSTGNESENDQSSTSSTQFYETYEVQPRQRSSSESKKRLTSLNTDIPNSIKIPPLSAHIPHDKMDDESKIKPQASTPSQFFKFPTFSKGKSPFHFRNRERALSTVSSSDIPLFETTPTSKTKKIPSQFVNDEAKVKKISDSCLNPIPNFVSICSTIETIDKILSEFNKTKFDQFANTETRLKNITNSIQSFIRMSNRTKSNLKQIISECQVDLNSDEIGSSKSDNEFAHIKKNIHSLLLIKEEQTKKIKQQTKEISYLRKQIESLKVFIKNNQKQIAKFKQQFFGNLSPESHNNNNNNNSDDEIIFHLKQRSKSIDFFNSFLLEDENETQLNDFCNKLRITHEYAQLHSKIKQMDQLLCTIDNEPYIENTDVQFRLEKMGERISKLYRLDEDQITKNWTFICAEGAEIENPEIRSYFFEKQYSETQVKLLSLEKQRTKLFELFYSFSNNKKDSNNNNNNNNEEENDDDYIAYTISESIIDDLNEKNLIIEKKSKMLVDSKKEIDAKNKEIESIKKKLKRQMKENEELIRKYEEISNKFSESEAQLTSSLKENKSLNRKVNSLGNKNERLQKQLDEIREKNQKNGSITEIKNISNSLVGELSSVKLLADQQEEAINELYQIKEQLEDELEATKEALKDSMTDIQEKSESLKLIQISLDEEKEKLKTKDLETTEIKSLLEHQIEDNEKLKETLKTLTNSSDNDNDFSDSSIINSLQNQIKTLKEENDKKENQIKDLNKQVLASEPRLFTLRRKSLSQKNLINQLTAKTEEIRELIETQYQTEIDQLAKKVEELQFQLQSNQSGSTSIDLNEDDEITRLSKENYQLKLLVNELKDQIQQQNERSSQESLNSSNETATFTIDNENSSQTLKVEKDKDQSNDEIVIKCNVSYNSSSEDQINNSKNGDVKENESLIQNDIKELTTEIETLKKANNNLSSQLENYMKQLKLSQSQLRTIIQLITNENEIKSESETINDDEFSSIISKIQQNKQNNSSSNQSNELNNNELTSQIEKLKEININLSSNINNDSLCQKDNEIKELTTQNSTLKETNNNLSSQLENYKEQLQSSQTQLRTIVQLINNGQTSETETEMKPITDEEFSQITHKLQQNKEIKPQELNESSMNTEKENEIEELAMQNAALKETNNSLSSQLENCKKQLQSNETNNNENELTSQIEKLKETNINLSSQLENYKEQLQSSQKQLQTIVQLINNEQTSEIETETKPITDEEFSQITHKLQQNKEIKSQELIGSNINTDSLLQKDNEIKKLTSQNSTLKETNNNLSSQLENYKEQLQSSQNQLRTIVQLINSEQASETETYMKPITEDEFSQITHKLQQNKELKSQELNESNINTDSLFQKENEIKELTTQNSTLKETNNKLSSQLENSQMQLQSSQTQLRTILQLINNEQASETEIETKPITDEEFSQITHKLQQNKELKLQELNESNINNDSLCQKDNEIKELTTQNTTLKETNNKLSSQLENCKEQLQSSQNQLRTILQLIKNEQENKDETEIEQTGSINEEEFTRIVQQYKEKTSQESTSTSNDNSSPSITNERIQSRSIQLESKSDNEQTNNITELENRIEELEKERTKYIEYSSILSNILGKNINDISDEQLKKLIEEFHSKQNQLQINKNEDQSSKEEKEMIENQYQNEINELNDENEALQNKNKKLSSNLENCTNQLEICKKQIQIVAQIFIETSPENESELEIIERVAEDHKAFTKMISMFREKISQKEQNQNESNAEIEKLKQENRKLSSQVENNQIQLQSSQTQLRTIVQLINNEQASEIETEAETKPITEDEFSQITHKLQQNKELKSQELNNTKINDDSSLQKDNEIKELTTQNSTLKETNNNLSSQLENYKKQFQSSQKQLQTIIQLINNEQTSETEIETKPITEDEFSQITHKLQQNNKLKSQELNNTNINDNSLFQKDNEIKELTTLNFTLKETNNKLSSQLENSQMELQSSQTQLRTILKIIKNEQENKNQTEPITDDEFQQIIHKLQQNNQNTPHESTTINNNNNNNNNDTSNNNNNNNNNDTSNNNNNNNNNDTSNNDLIIASHENIQINKSKSSNSNSNNNYEREIIELRNRISTLEKENKMLKLSNAKIESKTDSKPIQKYENSIELDSISDPSFTVSEEYDDRYTICIPCLSKDYGYDSNRFSYDMSSRFGPILSASITTVYMPNENVVTFGFVDFISRSSDTKLFESHFSENDSYYLKSQVIVTNLPFGIKKEEAGIELAKFASSLSINLNKNNVKTVFFENSINPEFLIDFKEDVEGAKAFVDAFQSMNPNQDISRHMSGYVPLAFYYDPCPYKLDENRQKAIQKYASNARLIAMMQSEQFRDFDFNSYFNGLISKSENDTIYSHQIVADEVNDSDERYRLIVDRRFIVSDSYPQFKKLEVVFMNDLEAVLAQTYAMNYSCDILQIFHSNFKGNRIAGNDF